MIDDSSFIDALGEPGPEGAPQQVRVRDHRSNGAE